MVNDLKSAACVVALMACLVGCGRGGGMASLNGSVTYGGQPLEKGLITFVAEDGKGPTSAAPIVDGKFSVNVAYGRKIVKIEGYKVLGQHPFSRNNPRIVVDQEQILPPRYNTKSELTREITSSDHTCDFALEKSPPAQR